MDRKMLAEEAERFQGEGDCYLHIEMKGGTGCEVLMAGDGMAILHGLCGAIKRLGEIRGVDFATVLGALREMNEAAQQEGSAACGS